MENHANRTHALLSASGAYRWMHCTPSAVLEAQFPDTTSEAAKEGTLAHEMCEAKLQHFVNTDTFRKKDLTKRLGELKKDPLYKKEMDGFTDAYLDFIRTEALSYKGTPYVAIEKRLDLSNYIPEGFGTADCIMIYGSTLEVIDFKYGRGVPVSAENNPQMQLYALGALDAYAMLYHIDTVRMSIVQPRIDNTNLWEESADKLRDFGEKIKVLAEKAFSGEGVYSPGDWCMFCRARAICRTRADKEVQLAFGESFNKSADLLSNDEIGRFLELGESVASWLSQLKEYALSQCLAGKAVAGFKAVNGRSTRKWDDTDKAFASLIEQGVEEAMLYERTPLSVAKLEKALGKTTVKDMVGDHIVSSPGKPTLVPETDKRQAITNQISATEAFK